MKALAIMGRRSYGVLVATGILSALLGFAAIELASIDPQILITLAYMLVMIGVLLYFRKFPIGPLALLALTYPPYVEHELALKAVSAVRRAGAVGIRDAITRPILSFIDVYMLLILLIVLSTRWSLPKRGAKYLALAGALVISVAASSIANWIVADQQLSLAIAAGFSAYMKIPIICIAVFYSIRQSSDLNRLCQFFLVGAPVFLLQSTYITVLKQGGITIGRTQATGLLAGPGGTGAFVLLILPFLGSILFLENRNYTKTMALMMLCASVAYMLMTYTRSVYLGFAIALIIIFAGMRVDRKTRAKMFVLLLLLIFIVFLLFDNASDFIARKFVAILAEDSESSINLAARLVYWSQALELLRCNPLLGVGPNSWGLLTEVGGSNVHNGYLEVALGIGLVGVVFFAVLVVMGLSSGIKTLKFAKVGTSGHRISLVITGVVGGYMATQLFSSSVMSQRIVIILWTLLSLNIVIGHKMLLDSTT